MSTTVAARRPVVAPVRSRLRSTPGLLSALLGVLALAIVAAAVATVWGVRDRSSATDTLRTSSGPLAVQAQELYRSLSDADATAASAFLTGGTEPPALRGRYEADLAAASRALAATAGARGAAAQAAATVAQALPVYSGLVETARADNRLGLPVGAAYLREASGLMRGTLLPAAASLYDAETAGVAQDRGSAAGFPWLAIPLVVLTLAGLIVIQRWLFRRTHRVINLGLAGASLALLILLGWLAIGYGVAAGHLSASNDRGSAQVRLLVEARIAALTARADESLTLVARGNGAVFEKDFQTTMARLTGNNGPLARANRSATDSTLRADVRRTIAAVSQWNAGHKDIRAQDDGGNFPQAVLLAIGPGPGSAASRFAAADAALAAGIDRANATFARQARAAGGAFTGEEFGLSVLAALALVGCALGLQQRIAEYR